MLLVICLAELLERYGNYLIAALLPLFLNEHERLGPAVALRLVGYYLALGYAGGVAGGLVADRLLGYRLATRLGTVLFGLGAALLTAARPGTLYPALALLVLGSSFFKPALSAWLGSLYAAGDVRQGAGFAWFYFAANIGAVVAPFVGGALRTRYSWPLAFATTALAFALCLLVVLVGQIGAPVETAPSLPVPPSETTAGDAGSFGRGLEDLLRRAAVDRQTGRARAERDLQLREHRRAFRIGGTGHAARRAAVLLRDVGGGEQLADALTRTERAGDHRQRGHEWT